MEWIAVAPHGDEGFLWIEPLFALLALGLAMAFLFALAGLAFRRVRREAAILAVCSATYLIALFLAASLGESVRMRAFHRLSERSKPLIAAIRAYEQKNGHPPQSLRALVPEFIPSVPATGMGAYPEYRYYAVSNSYGDPWCISVFTGRGLSFDQFIYFPLTNYPATGYGGWLERVGDWAYVHE